MENKLYPAVLQVLEQVNRVIYRREQEKFVY